MTTVPPPFTSDFTVGCGNSVEATVCRSHSYEGPSAETWCPCRRHGSPQTPLTLTSYNRAQEQPDIGVNLVEMFWKEGASFKCFVWNGVQFEWQFFFSSQKPFCLFLLPPLYFSICHFNYSTAAYFYTSSAISRNTRERAVKILGGGS